MRRRTIFTGLVLQLWALITLGAFAGGVAIFCYFAVEIAVRVATIVVASITFVAQHFLVLIGVLQ